MLEEEVKEVGGVFSCSGCVVFGIDLTTVLE